MSFFLSGASTVYSVSASWWWPYFILKHLWHSILTPPLFRDWLLTQIWTKSNDFSGTNWWMIGLQNCKDETAEHFDPAPKNGKNLLYAFLFFVGYTINGWIVPFSTVVWMGYKPVEIWFMPKKLCLYWNGWIKTEILSLMIKGNT